MGTFIVNGKQYRLPVFEGVTCENDIRQFANHMGWATWEFSFNTGNGWVNLSS